MFRGKGAVVWWAGHCHLAGDKVSQWHNYREKRKSLPGLSHNKPSSLLSLCHKPELVEVSLSLCTQSVYAHPTQQSTMEVQTLEIGKISVFWQSLTKGQRATWTPARMRIGYF